MLTRHIDYLKMNEVTSIFTSLTAPPASPEKTAIGFSSLADTWILLRGLESQGERNRVIYILKSRGMAHSSQLREFLLTDKGIRIVDADVDPSGALTGSARASQEACGQAEEVSLEQEASRKRRQLDTRRKALEARGFRPAGRN